MTLDYHRIYGVRHLKKHNNFKEPTNYEYFEELMYLM